MLAYPFWLRKTTTDPHVLAHVKLQCTDDKYPKLEICISALILDSYEYIPVAYVSVFEGNYPVVYGQIFIVSVPSLHNILNQCIITVGPLLLAPELFFLILAHHVYKMRIVQEPNKLAL